MRDEPGRSEDLSGLHTPLPDSREPGLTWVAITRLPTKADLYARETYFREGLAEAHDLFGGQIGDLARRAALLMVKPEGIAGGKVGTILRFLADRGFAIAAVASPFLTRWQWREMWRYQLSAATLDRILVNDHIMQDRVLMLLLRYDGPLGMPATVQLSLLKGPSDVALQPADCLRRILGQKNRLFSLFHAADEPADLFREVAILLDSPQRRDFLSGFAARTISSEHLSLVDDAVALSEASRLTFDPAASLARLERACADLAADPVRADIARMRRGETIDWRELVKALNRAQVQIDRWDLALIGATHIRYDRPGGSKTIGSVTAERWLDPHGTA